MPRVEDRHPTIFHRRCMKADGLFMIGKDSKQIAAAMKVREGYALKLMTTGRSMRLGLPIPYEGK